MDLIHLLHLVRNFRSQAVHDSLHLWQEEGDGQGIDLSVDATSLYRNDNREWPSYDISFSDTWWGGAGQDETYNAGTSRADGEGMGEGEIKGYWCGWDYGKGGGID